MSEITNQSIAGTVLPARKLLRDVTTLFCLWLDRRRWRVLGQRNVSGVTTVHKGLGCRQSATSHRQRQTQVQSGLNKSASTECERLMYCM